MKRGAIIYGLCVATAVALAYAVELYLPFKPMFGSWSLVPWLIDIGSYTVLGGITWIALRSVRLVARIALISLVAILPHVLPELAGRTDPAYPHIGLLLIVPDLVWIALGAAIAALIASRTTKRGKTGDRPR
jgi:hypothetical protein